MKTSPGSTDPSPGGAARAGAGHWRWLLTALLPLPGIVTLILLARDGDPPVSTAVYGSLLLTGLPVGLALGIGWRDGLWRGLLRTAVLCSLCMAGVGLGSVVLKAWDVHRAEAWGEILAERIGQFAERTGALPDGSFELAGILEWMPPAPHAVRRFGPPRYELREGGSFELEIIYQRKFHRRVHGHRSRVYHSSSDHWSGLRVNWGDTGYIGPG